MQPYCQKPYTTVYKTLAIFASYIVGWRRLVKPYRLECRVDEISEYPGNAQKVGRHIVGSTKYCVVSHPAPISRETEKRCISTNYTKNNSRGT